jgi:hypothetical protein
MRWAGCMKENRKVIKQLLNNEEEIYKQKSILILVL